MSVYVENIQDNNIYRLYSDKGYYLKITPSKQPEDRRYPIDVVKGWLANKTARIINSAQAKKLANMLWDDFECIWTHNGKRFKASKELIVNIPDRKWHDFKDDWRYHTIPWGICYFHGSIHWWRSYNDGRIVLEEFKDINSPPEGNFFFTSIKHLHPIYEEVYDSVTRKNKWVLI